MSRSRLGDYVTYGVLLCLALFLIACIVALVYLLIEMHKR